MTRIERNLTGRKLLGSDEPVLLGLSGGVDSMVLFHALREIAARCHHRLEVAHFNHHLRGTESDEDEKFVRKTAEEHGIPIHLGGGGVAEISKREGISIEMAARSLRHEFLTQTARANHIYRIALGHHADDQVETFWLRLLRGNAGTGLSGMRWQRAAGGGAAFIRPMLDISRAEIESFAQKHEVPFRIDSSNSKLDVERNRLRHEILPLLRQFQPQLDAISLRTAEILAAEKSCLQELAAEWLADPHCAFMEQPEALQREIVHLQLIALGATASTELIESLRVKTVPVTAPGGKLLCRDTSGIVSHCSDAIPDFLADEQAISLQGNTGTRFGGLEIRWEHVARRGDPCEGTEYLDGRRIGDRAMLRHWRPGDRFRQIGTAQASKLQDLFTNAKVPAEERRRRVVAVNESGVLVWVEGLRIAEEFRVRDETADVLRWSWRRFQ